MGAYRSKPITTKESFEEQDSKLSYGASSMQGWRLTQEDAHNCILSFDTNAALFAVYDGHGGHEVAQYCSEQLPEFLKSLPSYQNGDYTKALEEAFLGFDATIVTEKITALLAKIAKEKKEDDDDDEDYDRSDEDEENVNHLYEEARMPIEEVMRKYTSKLSFEKCEDEKKSVVKAGSSSDNGVGSSSDAAEIKTLENGVVVPKIVVNCPEGSDDVKAESNEEKTDVSKEVSNNEKNDDVKATINDEKSENSEQLTESSTGSSKSPIENGDVSKKGKGKALVKTKGIVLSPAKTTSTRPKRSVQQMYAKLLDFGEGDSDDSEDEEDKTFEGPNDDSSDDDDAEEEEDEEEDEDGTNVDDSEEDDDTAESLSFEANDLLRGPGRESGCTAIVALLKENTLYVANAGDSRCIVCRNGVAIDMSVDHKPDDQPEMERVQKAGGGVYDGRVDGGLNLSRAIGDHQFKRNKELSDREQMITALPDVKTLTVNPQEDEFMVLACDGIWNIMTSQEVVDFVKPRLQEKKKLAAICEDLFEHCLAPDTSGDGCDNMTAIIVQFKPTMLKRSLSPEPETSGETKRSKTEVTDESSNV